MDVIETIKKDKAYLKCKFIVKNWEKEFKLKHARTPSKFDIKEAPSNIKYAYKKYFNLKSEALENSLSVYEADTNDIGSPEIEDINLVIDVKDLDQEPILSTLPTGQELEQLLSNSKVQNNFISSSPFTENLSRKLFQNRKFSLRNPRKFSSNKSYSQPSKNDTDHSEVPKNNNESIFSSMCQISTSIECKKIDSCVNDHKTLGSTSITDIYVSNMHSTVNSINDNLKTASVRQINTAWLERATGMNNEFQINKNVEVIDNPVKEKLGLRNVDLTHAEKISDYIENSESEVEDVIIEKLKPALKKRKIQNLDTLEFNDKHDNKNFDNGNLNEKAKLKSVKRKSKNIKEHLIEKKEQCREEQPPDIREYLPFGIDKQVIPRAKNVTDILDTLVQPSAVTLIKNQSDSELGKLEKKIMSGTVNDNFVKVNLEKKIYVRGRKSFNFSTYKKKQWKNKKALHSGMEFPESGKIACFKCGLTGHMARYCTSHKENSLLPLENLSGDDIPTLEDMEKIVQKNPESETIEGVLSTCINSSSEIPEYFLKLLEENPITESNSDSQLICPDKYQNKEELYDALKMFGYESFRTGQEQAIMRILSGKSTLLILSTGGGKSLCYQLPAYIYRKHTKCITLVISPLVSLMEDQVLNMPDFLKAGCLHTNQPPTQRRKIIEYLKKGEINVLLISPEALISGDTSNGFAGLFKSLPKIAFACIDEAHCVSQWSHNFRPSYLMICRILREKLNVKCILGLTATASQSTIKSVIDHFNIPDGIEGVVQNPTLPDNLYLSVSFEKDKDRALIAFLNSNKIIYFNSIIVYCIRRNECERVAAVLRSCLSQPEKINMEKQNKKRKRMSYVAEAYHAGMSAAQRKKIQKNFMDGTLKIIVATVAFGMGINKSDIRCIIHYNMPASFESYVQEVGRAGRDGEPAYCHVFINDCNSDKNELLKHIYANSIDRSIIRRLLQKVFIPCKCANELKNNSRCRGHEVGIPIDSTVEELDLPSENIATLLCYVELHSKQYIKVLNNAYTCCKIISYGGPKVILEAAKTCPPLAMAYLIESKKNPDIIKSSILELNVIEAAAAIGWESGMTKYHLKNLEWETVAGSSKRSQLKVELNTLGFRIKAQGDLAPTELDSILDDLHKLVCKQEAINLHQLEEIDKTFRNLCNCLVVNDEFDDQLLEKNSNELKTVIKHYFQRESDFPTDIDLPKRPLDIDCAISDIRALIATYKDCKFTGRSIARIFQGISSPNFPAIVWGKCKFWRSHIHEDFHELTKIATQQIIHMN
ncbi:ATP-dependent DNA helicase Q4 [Battus philenor]|uniref:ATP-dependent DNA helicase Q4 n=1 Tax=Battus philenor TaxID=42288 RepID=UPI0035D0B218